jgi:hypothetical protein
MIAADDDGNISFVPSCYLGRLFDRQPTDRDELPTGAAVSIKWARAVARSITSFEASAPAQP